MTRRPPPEPILALDVPTADAARDLVARMGGSLSFVKIGLELFTAAGPGFVREIRGAGREIFLDLKFHDIPSTVAGAVRSACALDVSLLTLHGAGGPEMLRAAREAADGCKSSPRLLAVTVLTSGGGDAADAPTGGGDASVGERVRRMAGQAIDAGADGVVCSAREAEAVRRGLGDDILVVCPGIRRGSDDPGDQRRIATPAEAVRAGASHLVIGRTVTLASDPAAAFREIRGEMDAAHRQTVGA